MIDKIVVHCADTPIGMDIGAKEINEWHLAKGWSAIGYGYVIRLDGTVELGRDLDGDGEVLDETGAHVLGHNENSVGICLVGGYLGEFTYTRAQLVALERTILDILIEYPSSKVCGHNELDASKPCPNFNVREWWYNKQP